MIGKIRQRFMFRPRNSRKLELRPHYLISPTKIVETIVSISSNVKKKMKTVCSSNESNRLF